MSMCRQSSDNLSKQLSKPSNWPLKVTCGSLVSQLPLCSMDALLSSSSKPQTHTSIPQLNNSHSKLRKRIKRTSRPRWNSKLMSKSSKSPKRNKQRLWSWETATMKHRLILMRLRPTYLIMKPVRRGKDNNQLSSHLMATAQSNRWWTMVTQLRDSRKLTESSKGLKSGLL